MSTTIPHTPKDERKSERRIMRVRGLLEHVGTLVRYEIRTENVSAEGVAIRMPVALQAGSRVNLAFSMAAGSNPVNISLSAQVVHTLLSGDTWLTGLSITAISDGHRNILTAYSS